MSKKEKNPTKEKTEKKGIAWALGFSDIKKGVEATAEGIAESGDRTKSLYSKYKQMLRKKKDVRNETFEQAVARLGLSQKDLEQRKKELNITAYLFMAVLAGTSYVFFTSLFNLNLINAFTTLCLMLFEGSLVFYNLFRAWQIESRKLGNYKEFIQSLR